MRVVGYARVSTDGQADSGAGLAAQRSAIEADATRREWQLVEIFEDAGATGARLGGREGLEAALSAVETGDADALVVAKLDRLSRSLMDFASLIDRARRQQWTLVALDLGVDTSTPAGELVANVMASVAQWERRAIGERTREALAVKREQGVQLGRRRSLSADVRARIGVMRDQGATLRTIARTLNDERVPTAQGGRRWHPETVRQIIRASASCVDHAT